jgi:hypothetical protein
LRAERSSARADQTVGALSGEPAPIQVSLKARHEAFLPKAGFFQHLAGREIVRAREGANVGKSATARVIEARSNELGRIALAPGPGREPVADFDTTAAIERIFIKAAPADDRII